jgi:hypothetical protein
MSSELMMDSGISGKTKAMILGGVVIAFALTIGILMRSGKSAAEPESAAGRSARAEQAPPAVPDSMLATSDTQMASNEMTSQAATPAAAVVVGAASTTGAASPEMDTAAQVATDEPATLAAVSPATEPQDIGGWSRASLDDSGADSPEPQVAIQSSTSQPRPAVRPAPPPAIDVLQQWWRDPGTSRGFDVQYVGQAASGNALVFRFSKNIADAQNAARHIRVTDDKGETPTGAWVAGNNPYVLVYQGVSTGRYMVSIDAALASASGAKLGASLQGPVYVN